MEGIDNLQIYIGTQIPLIGTPLVISALSFNMQGDCICERYCFVHDFKKSVFMADDIYQYDNTDIGNPELSDDPAAFLNKMIVDDANYFADRALYELYVCKGVPAPELVVLAKTDSKQVNNIWMTGKFENELKTIKEETQCAELRQLLNKITMLPIVAHRIAGTS